MESGTTSLSQDKWRLPPGSWDTHVHVFEPGKYPYSPTRAYSPRTATFRQLKSFSQSLTSDESPANMVLVLPSPYGTLNESILDLLREHEGPEKLRGIVVLDPSQVKSKELIEMDKLGVKGVRLNVVSSGAEIDVEVLKRSITQAAEMIKGAGLDKKWWIQLFIPGPLWNALSDTIQSLGVTIIADHFGGMKGSSMLAESASVTEQPGFDTIIKLASSKKLVVKISGFARASEEEQEVYPDLEPIVKRLAAKVPDQLIWANDWPHTDESKDRKGRSIDITEPFRAIDDAAILKKLRSWVRDEVWARMMVETPKKMYT